MTRMRGVALLAVLGVISAAAGGQVLTADWFSCSGEGTVCWLSNPRLTDSVTWRFVNVPTGEPIPLVLDGVANDICTTCGWGRDVLVRLYYRADGDRYWQRVELWLRNVSPNPDGCLLAYPVWGETKIFPPGPNLEIVAQRVLSCDPHVGFSRGSLALGARPIAVAPVPVPTLPIALLPLPTPPPPGQPTCIVEPGFLCTPGDAPPACLPAGVDLATVARQTLPESLGPDDATILGPGHYVGRLGEDDFQDWYRIQMPFGQGAIVWLDSGDLTVDVYLVHDPCGYDLAVCLNVRGRTVLNVPCVKGMLCFLGLNGLSECFSGDSDRCRYFIRIVRRSGDGNYRLSILTGAS